MMSVCLARLSTLRDSWLVWKFPNWFYESPIKISSWEISDFIPPRLHPSRPSTTSSSFVPPDQGTLLVKRGISSPNIDMLPVFPQLLSPPVPLGNSKSPRFTMKNCYVSTKIGASTNKHMNLPDHRWCEHTANHILTNQPGYFSVVVWDFAQTRLNDHFASTHSQNNHQSRNLFPHCQTTSCGAVPAVYQQFSIIGSATEISNLRDVLRGDRSLDPGRQDHLVGTLEEGHALLTSPGLIPVALDSWRDRTVDGQAIWSRQKVRS